MPVNKSLIIKCLVNGLSKPINCEHISHESSVAILTLSGERLVLLKKKFILVCFCLESGKNDCHSGTSFSCGYYRRPHSALLNMALQPLEDERPKWTKTFYNIWNMAWTDQRKNTFVL